jgi:hypothetical protein
MYLGDNYTTAANLAGLPGLSIPAGFVDGLPVGMQMTAAHFDARPNENGRLMAAVLIPTNPYPPTPNPLSARNGGRWLLNTGIDPS